MQGRHHNLLPQARTEGLLVERVGDETIALDIESGEAHCLRPLASAVFARCDGKTSVARLQELVAADLREAVEADAIEDALAQLAECGLLTVQDAGSELSRRQMLRRTAAAGGAAMATPLVASILTPSSALAWGGTNVHCKKGFTCKTDSDCIGGNSFPVGSCHCKSGVCVLS